MGKIQRERCIAQREIFFQLYDKNFVVRWKGYIFLVTRMCQSPTWRLSNHLFICNFVTKFALSFPLIFRAYSVSKYSRRFSQQLCLTAVSPVAKSTDYQSRRLHILSWNQGVNTSHGDNWILLISGTRLCACWTVDIAATLVRCWTIQHLSNKTIKMTNNRKLVICMFMSTDIKQFQWMGRYSYSNSRFLLRIHIRNIRIESSS